MHNSREDNLRFLITHAETNIRYLLGETPINHELINRLQEEIIRAKKELARVVPRPAGY